MRAWWIVLLAGCGGHAAKPAAPAPKGPQIALAEVDAKAFGVVHAASYLIVGADGKLQIGAVDARGEVDVSALTPTATEDLSGWFYVEAPPIPRPPGEEQMGILGALDMGALGSLGGGFGTDVFGDTGEYPTTTVGCGTALHLDAAADTPVALLIADAGADAHAVLAALEQMPRPVALVARGNDPRGQALRLIVDGTANLTSDYPQGVVKVKDGESAGELLAAIGEHAAKEVGEVVIDLGATCTIVDMSGGYGFGGFGDDPDMWGDDPGTGGYNDGWGTIGTGSGGGGSGYGVGGGGFDQPLVSVGMPEVTGDVDISELQERLAIMSPELGDCLATEPDSAGVVTVKVSFTAEGKVTKATATGVTDTLDRCVEQLIMSIPFPEGTADARATIPIKFGA